MRRRMFLLLLLCVACDCESSPPSDASMDTKLPEDSNVVRDTGVLDSRVDTVEDSQVADADAMTASCGTEYLRDRRSGPAAGELRAFPGAEGFGAQTIGGRGGRVIYVTNLDDSGEGSLRAALEASGPRTVLFKVSGTIGLDSTILISSANLTVAGQSAPGAGIALRHSGAEGFGEALIRVSTNDVILRYLRFRRGPSAELECCGDNLTLVNAENVIIDHCSMSWSTNFQATVTGNSSKITLQNTIFSEGLRYSTHIREDGMRWPHPNGVSVTGNVTEMTFYRNLFSRNGRANPSISSRGGRFQIANNLMTAFCGATQLYSQSTTAQYNIIHNYHEPARLLCDPSFEMKGELSVFMDGNRTVFTDITLRDEGTYDPWMATSDYGELPPAALGLQSFERFDMPVLPLIDASEIKVLLDAVGASQPVRDSRDSALVTEARLEGTLNKTFTHYVELPSDVGGWPRLESCEPYPDQDEDGMDDIWEASVGLDPSNPQDGNSDADGDGYTNLEWFLNGT